MEGQVSFMVFGVLASRAIWFLKVWIWFLRVEVPLSRVEGKGLFQMFHSYALLCLAMQRSAIKTTLTQE